MNIKRHGQKEIERHVRRQEPAEAPRPGESGRNDLALAAVSTLTSVRRLSPNARATGSADTA